MHVMGTNEYVCRMPPRAILYFKVALPSEGVENGRPSEVGVPPLQCIQYFKEMLDAEPRFLPDLILWSPRQAFI